MNASPASRPTDSVWPVTMFATGVATVAGLLGATWYIRDPVGHGWEVWNWVIASQLLIGPYLLSATALRSDRGPNPARPIVRWIAVGIIVAGAPGLLLAGFEIRRFEPNTPRPFVVHLVVAVFALVPQYIAAITSAALVLLGQPEENSI